MNCRKSLYISSKKIKRPPDMKNFLKKKKHHLSLKFDVRPTKHLKFSNQIFKV